MKLDSDTNLYRYDGKPATVAIIQSVFNKSITDKLVDGALDFLKTRENIFQVPGAFEIPLAAKWLAESGKYDGLIALGAIIKGDTPHFDYVCAEVSRGISVIALQFDIPIAFGVLTTLTVEQALERSGGKIGNKGREAAETVLRMISLKREVKHNGK